MPEVRRTACNRDCPDACSILVTVEDDGRASRLRGDPEDPVTRGFLCERTDRFLNRQYAADRLTQPLVRRNGTLVPLSWDAALDLAAEQLSRIRAESGAAAILHYRSGGSLGMLKTLSSYLFECFGPVTVKRGDICSGAGDAAQETDFGFEDSNALHDLLHSRVIVLWGKNPHVSGPHLLPVLNEARRRGTRIIGMDPVRTRAAGLCEVFLQPRPGADYALAMLFTRVLFERGWEDKAATDYCDNLEAFLRLAFARPLEGWAREADVELADAVRAAELYGSSRPAAILVGWGMGRRRNGSATIRALDALGAVSGNLGVAGGGVSYYFHRRRPFDVSFLQGEAAAPRTLAEARLGHEILAATDPPIRAIWVCAGNPVAMLPDSRSLQRAFAHAEFSVVVDTHPSDTTDCAQLVLPTLTLLEDDDVLGAYGNHWLRVSRPALAAPPGARHELEILQGLAARLGLGERLAGSPADWKRRLLSRVAAKGVTLETLEAGPALNPLAPRVLFADRKFPTASGRVQLLDESAGPPVAPSSAFPLTLLAVSTPKAQSSQWSMSFNGPVEARVHPHAARGLGDGDGARLESPIGSLEVRIRLDPSLRRDVVLLPKGGQLRDGRAANLLVQAVETDAGGGAAYYDETVRLVAANARA